MENPTKSVSTIASPKFKNLWENLCIKIEKYMQEKNFCGVIDTYRLLLEQIHFERKNNRLSCQSELKLKEKCLSKYAKLIDDSKGINNYSEISRSLTIARSNKNTLWKSTLQTSSDDELLALIAPNQSKTAHVNFCDSALKLHSIKSQTQDRYIGIDTFWKRISNVIYNGRTLGLAGNTMDFNSRNSTIVNVQGKNLTSSKELHKFDKSYKRKPNELSLKSTGCEPKKLCPYEPKLFVENHERINATLKRKRQNQLADGNLSSENCKLNSPDNLFKTARQVMESKQRNDQKSQPSNSRKCLGGTRRGPSSKFVAPMQNSNTDKREDNETAEEIVDERLKNIDPKMVKIMLNEIMDHGSPVHWDDIAGLEFAKKTMKEIVVWPLLRPDIFKGLRGPPKGILLFGPPGTGKTLIGKCIASQSKSTFFCISASSLGSKWVGEGEKLVRALFAVARCYQPAVIFIDEIDSLLTQRSGTEHESSRRLKTEFLVQFDGVNTANDERLLVMGATNRPQELDEAARRRLVKRLYIPLPESHARRQIVKSLLNDHSHQLSERDLDTICNKSDGYSGADMTNLCKEAALGPIRSIKFDQIEFITSDQVRPIVLSDFMDALKQVRASVSDTDLDMYAKWNQTYGSG